MFDYDFDGDADLVAFRVALTEDQRRSNFLLAATCMGAVLALHLLSQDNPNLDVSEEEKAFRETLREILKEGV